MDMQKYEAVIILDSDLSEDAVKTEIGKVETTVKAHAGSVERSDVWGRRRLSFRIAKKEYGTYIVLVFAGDNRLVADLDRQLKINEGVLRHLIVLKDDYAPDFSARLMNDRDDAPGPFGDGEEPPVGDDFVGAGR